MIGQKTACFISSFFTTGLINQSFILSASVQNQTKAIESHLAEMFWKNLLPLYISNSFLDRLLWSFNWGIKLKEIVLQSPSFSHYQKISVKRPLSLLLWWREDYRLAWSHHMNFVGVYRGYTQKAKRTSQNHSLHKIFIPNRLYYFARGMKSTKV